MNDQETSVAAVRRPSAAPWLILALVVILAAVAVYFLVAGKAGAAFDAASMVPQDCVMAMTVDLNKSPDKDAAKDVILSMFKDAGIQDPEKELFRSLSREMDVDFEKDVLARSSLTGAIAVLPEMTNLTPGVLFVIGAKSEADAVALMDIILKQANKHGSKLQKKDYQGFAYYTESGGYGPQPLMGAVKSGIVIALSESAYKKVVDTATGANPSLLDDTNYTKLRETNNSTVATFFMSGPNYFKMLKPMMSMGMGGGLPPSIMEKFEQQSANLQAVVGRADASADGVKMEAKGITTKASPNYGMKPLDELAASAPEDAAILAVITGWEKAWPEMKKLLLDSPELKTYIDQALQMAKMQLGFDPLADLLDRITELAIYYVPERAVGWGFPGHIVMAVTVDNPGVVGGALSRAVGRLAIMGLKLQEVGIAGSKVYLGPKGNDGTQVGLAMAGDKLIFTVSGTDAKAAMSMAIDTAMGKGSSVAASSGFQLCRKYLADTSQCLFYGDATPIVEAFRSQMGAEEQKVADAMMRRVGPFALTSRASGMESSMQAVMPFKP